MLTKEKAKREERRERAVLAIHLGVLLDWIGITEAPQAAQPGNGGLLDFSWIIEALFWCAEQEEQPPPETLAIPLD